MIITLAIEGDRHAFTELVKRQQSMVRHLMRRLCADDALADDLSQQVFLQVFLKISKLKDHRAFGGWQKRIAINIWLQHCRKRDLLKDTKEPDDLFKPERDVTIALDLNAALNEFSHPARLCLVLSYQEGMSHQEIANTTGMPLGTVKSHITRGTQKLKQYLGAYQAQSMGSSLNE